MAMAKGELVPAKRAAEMMRGVLPRLAALPGVWKIKGKTWFSATAWRAVARELGAVTGYRVVAVRREVRDGGVVGKTTIVARKDEDEVLAEGLGFAPDGSYQSYKSNKERDRVAFAQERADRVAFKSLSYLLFGMMDDGDDIDIGVIDAEYDDRPSTADVVVLPRGDEKKGGDVPNGEAPEATSTGFWILARERDVERDVAAEIAASCAGDWATAIAQLKEAGADG